MTYRYVTVGSRDKVLKGTDPIAWITVGTRSPSDGATGGFAPSMRVYTVHRYSERARDKRGERVGERTSHRAAFELAVSRCG